MTRPVFLLSDFGLTDTYVGIVKAVILSISPQAHVHDLTHNIPPQDIRAGAYSLLTAAPFLPAGAVVLGVVDPGVGSNRRPIAVQSGSYTFVGPDNGLLSWALTHLAARHRAADAETIAQHAVVLDHRAFWLPQVSTTFHGRDIFGPVAAHLANGVRLSALGTPTNRLVRLPFPAVTRDTDADGAVRTAQGEVIHVDQFGNLITNLRERDLPPDPVTMVGHHTIRGLVSTYEESVGPLLAMIGSVGYLEIAAPNGSAAVLTGQTVGARVEVSIGNAEGRDAVTN